MAHVYTGASRRYVQESYDAVVQEYIASSDDALLHLTDENDEPVAIPVRKVTAICH